jgi:hypothetical protein
VTNATRPKKSGPAATKSILAPKPALSEAEWDAKNAKKI